MLKLVKNSRRRVVFFVVPIVVVTRIWWLSGPWNY